MNPAADGAGDGPASRAASRVVAADEATVLGLFRGVTVFRALALVWAVTGAVSSRAFLAHPWAAVGLLGAIACWTALVSMWPQRGPLLPVRARWVIVTELMLGAGILLGDGFVYDAGRAISLSWSWPAAGVMAAGVAYGWRAGLVASVAMVTASLITEFRLDTNLSEPVQAFSRVGLWVATGLLAGYVASRLRRAEAEVSLARAREEVARTLHDGVLQTLAVIQRRSDDHELAALARDQEADLRRYLSGSPERPSGGLEPELRRLAQRHQRLYPSVTVSVVVAPDASDPPDARLEALLGAAGEALTNVGKHAEASRVTVYVEPADPEDLPAVLAERDERDTGAAASMLFVSVRDDGVGFDPATVTERIGLSRSIRERIVEAGGDVEIASRPGRGTEVKLWI